MRSPLGGGRFEISGVPTPEEREKRRDWLRWGPLISVAETAAMEERIRLDRKRTKEREVETKRLAETSWTVNLNCPSCVKSLYFLCPEEGPTPPMRGALSRYSTARICEVCARSEALMPFAKEDWRTCRSSLQMEWLENMRLPEGVPVVGIFGLDPRNYQEEATNYGCEEEDRDTP